MAEREEEIDYSCFRCGSHIHVSTDLIRPSSCEDCGNVFLLTYQEALDLLNDLYVKEKFKPKIIVEDDIFFITDET